MNQKCPSCNSENTGILHDSDNLNSPVLFYCNNCDMEISEFCPFCNKTIENKPGKVRLTRSPYSILFLFDHKISNTNGE